ncbi:hypothetical protein [Arthrobacter sp. M4]|uniref:hypothetical protein n=1 Tax=Arthrobacter sp. M4 TaxID=218160 RepID=UPI001CDC7FA4|nr:hypothetical protein [Arthrobacter sp. M4]MCA4135297.1 hypothetical protein [Arthrobacter sp. M4]
MRLPAPADAGVVSTLIDVERFLATPTTGRLVNAGTWQQMTDSSAYDLGVQTTED